MYIWYCLILHIELARTWVSERWKATLHVEGLISRADFLLIQNTHMILVQCHSLSIAKCLHYFEEDLHENQWVHLDLLKVVNKTVLYHGWGEKWLFFISLFSKSKIYFFIWGINIFISQLEMMKYSLYSSWHQVKLQIS